MIPLHQIRAAYNETTIRIYQAYSSAIAKKALCKGTFVSPPFKMERMTWIKPSFLWMMYRSGWGYKSGQEYILAIDIKREGFEWALKNSILSHFNETFYISYDVWKTKLSKTPVRIQWDPERDIFLDRLEHRSIQIGLSGIAVKKYVNDWIINIQDITAHSQKIYDLIQKKEIDEAKKMLPVEKVYNLPEAIKKSIDISN